jgi:hypothetical protein
VFYEKETLFLSWKTSDILPDNIYQYALSSCSSLFCSPGRIIGVYGFIIGMDHPCQYPGNSNVRFPFSAQSNRIEEGEFIGGKSKKILEIFVVCSGSIYISWGNSINRAVFC